MTSFNHYALGAVAYWLHGTVAGLAPTEPGYRRLRVEPRPGGGLTHARARLHTPYGLAEVSWTLDGTELTVDALVPPNTTAEVVLPDSGGDAVEVGSGRYRWTVPYASADAELAPLSVDMSIDALLDREEAARVFKDLLIAYIPEATAFIDSGSGAPAGTTVRAIAGMIPDGETFLSDLEARFAELEDRV